MWYALMDMEFGKRIPDKKEGSQPGKILLPECQFLNEPKLYLKGLDNKNFTPWVFWSWIFYAIA
jgi:hypothetical protein